MVLISIIRANDIIFINIIIRDNRFHFPLQREREQVYRIYPEETRKRDGIERDRQTLKERFKAMKRIHNIQKQRSHTHTHTKHIFSPKEKCRVPVRSREINRKQECPCKNIPKPPKVERASDSSNSTVQRPTEVFREG